MKTVTAAFNSLNTAQETAQALRDEGLDPHYIKVLTHHPEDGEVVALRGDVSPSHAATFTRDTADIIRGEALANLLRTDYGPDRKDTFMELMTDEDRSLLIAQVPEYMLDPVLSAVQARDPVALSSDHGNWHKANRPGEPTGFSTQTDAPRTADFYSEEQLAHGTREGVIDYDTRRSPYYDHYQAHYAPMGIDFDKYEPAYQFGWEAARKHTDIPSWSAAATAVQEQWEAEQPTPAPWQDVEDAIRHGWETNRADR